MLLAQYISVRPCSFPLAEPNYLRFPRLPSRLDRSSQKAPPSTLPTTPNIAPMAPRRSARTAAEPPAVPAAVLSAADPPTTSPPRRSGRLSGPAPPAESSASASRRSTRTSRSLWTPRYVSLTLSDNYGRTDRTTTASMVRRYISGPRFPDNHPSEAHISSLVDNFRETGTPEESLMPMLRGRFAALARARAFADCHGLVLPKQWTQVQPFSDARHLLDTYEELFFKFAASAPGVTTWLLPTHLLALMFAGHNVLITPVVMHMTYPPKKGKKMFGRHYVA